MTVSVAHLHRRFIPAFFLNFPLKVLYFFFPLSISAEHIHWASYLDLSGFNQIVPTKKKTVKKFLWAKEPSKLKIMTGCGPGSYFFTFFSIGCVQSRYFIAEHADVGEVPVELAEIKAVAHKEPVGHIEAPERDGNFNYPADFLVQESAYAEAARTASLEISQYVARGHSGIDNPFNEKYVPAFNNAVQIFGYAHGAARSVYARVAHYGNIIHLHGDRDLFYKIGHEDHTSLEHPDQQRQAIAVGSGYLFTHFYNAPLNGLL